jgi:hypothetical protein
MKILLEVFKDLWNFATAGFFKKRISNETKNLIKNSTKPAKYIDREIKVVSTNQNPVSQEIDHDLTPATGFAYVCVEKARCFIRPVWSFDGVFMILSYGDSVQIIKYEGRFVQIRVGDSSVWILKDDLISEKVDIFPVFSKDTVYLSDNVEVEKLRKLTNDTFFASEIGLPLLSIEFVSYRLSQDNRKIPWTLERPRIAGKWQNILKGQMGVRIGVEPKTGSVIEYYKDDDTGHIGYVKEVHADNSIVIQEVGREVEGEYTEKLFTKVEWQEWDSVFIQVT